MSALQYLKPRLYLPRLVSRAPKPASRLELKFAITTIHPDGSMGKTVVYPSHSWVKQMAQIFHAGLDVNQSAITGVDTADASWGIQNGVTTLHVVEAANADTRGIQVGTGTAAEDRDDNKLATKIAHGTSSGQLQYGACTITTAPSAITGGYRSPITRTFSNGSGGNITIEEIGLVLISNTASGNKNFLVIRDLTTHTVNNGAGVTVEYFLDFLV